MSDVSTQPESIAVIGMSGTYPGARSLEEYWDNLSAGVESITHFSDEEHEVPVWADGNANWIKAKGILDEPELFDAGFFGYTPEEARAMDPQHRIFLEKGWEAVEHAGYNVETCGESMGVFAGVSTNTYSLESMGAGSRGGPALFTDKDFIATRLSYRLNLRGPSIVVQSACSTSLVAVCMAAQSLLDYQCDLALAGGAAVWTPTRSGYPYQPGWPMSPDGHTRAFDARAAGFVPGSGAGAVLLKRLSDARADRDNILAVVRGFAVNNDGAGKIGYSAPSVRGQAEVITMAQEFAGVTADTISYVEAHGTGTELGDPVEITALTEAFRSSTDGRGYCAIGSVKTNIGHLDAAAGIASLQKAVLSLMHRQIPPSLNFESPNPKIDFESSPFFVNTSLREWTGGETPRRAGVNSFGIGGTNSHVVLEEAPAAEPGPAGNRSEVLTVSARSASALDQAAANLARWLESHPDANLADAAFTLQEGRKGFNHRRVVVADGPLNAAEQLRRPPAEGDYAVAPEGRREVVFMFPGQGAQYPQMARELYETEPVFREVIDRGSKQIQGELGTALAELIYPAVESEEATRELTRTLNAQPAIFLVEYALAQLWKKWGVEPTACIGHSIGEYVAACVAGVMSMEDGLRLVAERARLMDRMPAGAMVAVKLNAEQAEAWTGGDVVLAAVNAPELTVLAGPVEAVSDLTSRLQEAGVAAMPLKTSHAFHSPMMDPMIAEFQDFVSGIEMAPPSLPFVSNLTGTWIDKDQAVDPAYWASHLRRPVRFSDGARLLCDRDAVLLEVGPGRTLTGLVASQPNFTAGRAVSSLGQPRRGSSEAVAMWKAAGRLWARGVPIEWAQVRAKDSGRRIELPTYPFERRRYWALDDAPDGTGLQVGAKRTKKGPDDRFYVPSWKRVPAPGTPAPEDETWLVLTDGSDAGDRLERYLKEAGCRLATVRPGASYERIESGAYLMDPRNPAHYGSLMQDLADSDLTPTRVAHLLGTARPSNGASPGAEGRLSFYSLLYLAQAMGNARITHPVRIAAITEGAQPVLGEETLAAGKLLIQGPCRILPQEFSNLSCVHIDLPPAGALSDGQVAQVAAEAARPGRDRVVAFRHGLRWVQSYEPVTLGPVPENGGRLRKQGCYLVTGGLGGIGLVLSKWLAETAAARLVLTARTGFPERGDWTEWLLSKPEDDPVSRRIRGVQELEAAGADVLVLQADVTDEVQMLQVVAEANRRFGPVNGAIHAAGVAGGGIVQLKTEQMAERVLGPKVEGARVLNRVLKGQPVDFLVFCSSMSAIVGGFGQVDYAAANAFLDALAWENRAAGGPFTVSINWNAWNEVGMAVETQVPQNLRSLQTEFGLVDSISNAEGVDAFRRILGGFDEPQAAVSLTNLPEFLEQTWQTAEEVATRVGMPGESQPRPELATPYVAPATETEAKVAAIWQEVFGFDEVGRDDDFFELGGHSLLAVQLLKPLQDEFAHNLTLPVLFEHSTVRALAEFIEATEWATAGDGPGEDPDAGEREEITI